MAGDDPELSWLDDFFGPAIVRIGAFFFPKRPVLEFEATGQLQIDVEDNPLHKSTVVTFSGGGVPGGAVGSMQYHGTDGDDDVFAGTDNLTVDAETDVVTLTDGTLAGTQTNSGTITGGSITTTAISDSSFDDGDVTGDTSYDGTASHDEDYSDFVDTTTSSRARSQWKTGSTSNATPATITTISYPAATYGDCFITAHVEATYYYASSGAKGGNFAKKAVFKRSSGTLTRVAIEDLTITTLRTGTVAGGIDIDVDSNDAIKATATGITSTNIYWVFSIHAQMAAAPP